jgi:putative nucleotidyltransferase with HDIG domain
MQLLKQLKPQLQRTCQPKQAQSGSNSRCQVVILVSVLALTSALGQRFYNAPRLDVGRAAPQTIYAPASATVEDTRATEEKRKAARRNAMSILMLDQAVNQAVYRSLKRHLEQGKDLRQIAGPFPFTQTSILSSRMQSYLRQADTTDFQKVLNAVNATVPRQPTAAGRTSAPNSTLAKLNVGLMSSDQRQAIGELRTYRQSVGPQAYEQLVQTLTQTRFNYISAVNALPPPATPDAKPLYDASLLKLTETEWQQVQTRTLQVAERMLAQGIPFGLPEAVLKDAIKLHLKEGLSPVAQSIATQLLTISLQPNLIKDEEQTRAQAERAAQEVKPEMVSIRRSEVIVYKGEEISTVDFALLDHFGLSRRGTDWLGLLAFGGLVSGVIAVYWRVERRNGLKMRQRDRLLILLLCLSTPLLILLRVPSTNLPAVGLLVSTFYNSPLGLAVVTALTLLLPIGMSGLSWSELLASAAAGWLCASLAGRFRSRGELAILGAGAGVLQACLYLLLHGLEGGLGWSTLLGAAAIQGLMGLASCIVAIGISPYLEQVFDLVTTIRLLELANPNCALLKRLAAEAPGTFQHTIFVATLAEAAARELGCNVELVRTGTLYHDIGKMHDPLGFIENQMGGANKHDRLNDPWKSAAIIKKHVTEGLVMARKHHLPKAIQAFIPEHQGTMLIAYFYHQAQQRAQQDPTPSAVNETDFRYDGPAPQTRETGIVMLADSCEAALRSLKDATREEALSMINKILRARWQDDQLVNSGLTRDDLSKIATIFVEVWQQFNHQRIAYPKLGSAQPSPAKS